MTLQARLTEEREFHDRQAAERAGHFHQLGSLRFRDDDYLDHETWIRPAFARLGSLAGARVLDFGCGHGMAAVVLARRGGHVTAFDLSAGYVHEARRRAIANDVRIHFVQAEGERLPFVDGAFTHVWGSAVLHHLDPTTAAAELRRVLAPGGVAVFCEPWGENLLLDFARRRLPYPGKHRTVDERPLCRRDLRPFRRVFASVELEGFQLLSMLRRVVKPGGVVTALERLDGLLLNCLPGLRQFCRYVVLTLRR
jgi:ubiquinone/menaquinone biosynthesis C-methylase UbiE